MPSAKAEEASIPKISPVLQSLINTCLSTSQRSHPVMVLLEPRMPWEEALRRLHTLGLNISFQEKLIGVVFGEATPDVIVNLAALPMVNFIEPDEQESGSEGIG